MTIRRASENDIPAIRMIAYATWPVSYYPGILTAEQLMYMLDLLYSEAALTTAMREKNQHFYLLDHEEMTIGFTGLTHHHGGRTVTHLNKLYVRPSVQGTGAGKALLKHAMRTASESGDATLELNVNKRNKAIGFYERMGLRILREEVIDIGSGYVMDDYVMGGPL